MVFDSAINRTLLYRQLVNISIWLFVQSILTFNFDPLVGVGDVRVCASAWRSTQGVRSTLVWKVK